MRTHPWILASLVWTTGCSGDDKVVVPEDSDSPGTTDSDDSGTTHDSGTPDRPGTTLTVTVDGDLPGLAVNLHTVELGATSDAPFEIADGVRSDSTFTIDVEPPDDRWFVDLGDGSQGFAALPFAYIDDDENGVHTPDEQYVGLALEGALYIDGEPGASLASAGYTTGWNAIAVDLETAEMVPHAAGLGAITLAPQLIPQDRFVIEAVYDGPMEGRRVALIAETVESGAVMGPIMFDQPVNGTVQLPIDGPPPDEHLQDLGADGTQYRDWQYAVDRLYVYTDADGSGGWSASDPIEGTACAMGEMAVFQHTSEADKAFEALHLATHHIIPAWSFYLTLPDGAQYVRIDDAGPVTLSDSCLP